MFDYRRTAHFLPETILRDSRRNTCVMTVPTEAFLVQARREYVSEQPATVKLSGRSKSHTTVVTVVGLLSLVAGALTYVVFCLLR